VRGPRAKQTGRDGGRCPAAWVNRGEVPGCGDAQVTADGGYLAGAEDPADWFAAHPPRWITPAPHVTRRTGDPTGGCDIVMALPVTVPLPSVARRSRDGRDARFARFPVAPVRGPSRHRSARALPVCPGSLTRPGRTISGENRGLGEHLVHPSTGNSPRSPDPPRRWRRRSRGEPCGERGRLQPRRAPLPGPAGSLCSWHPQCERGPDQGMAR
jgi:hypothetical protein